jgi:nitrite reductase/ring-hydroxylating ferredoxin subunit
MPSAPKRKVRWVRVARVGDVPVDAVRRVEAEGQVLALVNRDGQFFALDAVCPHRGGPLDQGALWRGTLECPWHHQRYDPATGRNVYPANVYPPDLPALQAELRPAQVFPVRVVGGEVFVGLSERGAG